MQVLFRSTECQRWLPFAICFVLSLFLKCCLVSRLWLSTSSSDRVPGGGRGLCFVVARCSQLCESSDVPHRSCRSCGQRRKASQDGTREHPQALRCLASPPRKSSVRCLEGDFSGEWASRCNEAILPRPLRHAESRDCAERLGMFWIERCRVQSLEVKGSWGGFWGLLEQRFSRRVVLPGRGGRSRRAGQASLASCPLCAPLSTLRAHGLLWESFFEFCERPREHIAHRR